MTDLAEKTTRYKELLAAAVDEAQHTPPPDTSLHDAAATCTQMAAAYLQDGQHFQAEDDPVNALAAFAYGHAWLDAGARIGVLSVPTEGDLFAV